MSVGWNPWHGCIKHSEGCVNCFVYRIDSRFDRDTSLISRTKSFDLPRKRRRDKSFAIEPGQTVYTCFTSDFLLEQADGWRDEAWAMMRERSDLHFVFFTKRIRRLPGLLPADWGEGYANVTIGCTVENQKRAAERMPVFLEAPIRHRLVICAPLLGPLDLSAWLDTRIAEVSVGGESGLNARLCRYDWVLEIRRQCIDKRVAFSFHQTGARLFKDGRLYRIKKPLQRAQARKAGIDYEPDDDHEQPAADDRQAD